MKAPSQQFIERRAVCALLLHLAILANANLPIYLIPYLDKQVLFLSWLERITILAARNPKRTISGSCAKAPSQLTVCEGALSVLLLIILLGYLWGQNGRVDDEEMIPPSHGVSQFNLSYRSTVALGRPLPS
ncbi:hypothetical protein TNCV_235751 [Trichonephila clavipes]|nr:hypothetical protein TNCV_235751 [Trichonephila clavipes]